MEGDIALTSRDLKSGRLGRGERIRQVDTEPAAREQVETAARVTDSPVLCMGL